MTTGDTRAGGDVLLCPVLIGRAAQVERLRSALVRLAGGAGQTLLIAGEAGIGKSRLAAEARGDARRRGLVMLQGSCFEFDRALPYAPFIDLLRDVASGAYPEAVKGALAEDAPVFISAFPELATWMPGVAPAPPLEPELEKRRLMQSLEHFITLVAATGALVLLLEDLHWSDDSSLELVLQLSRRAATSPLLLIATFRSDELQPSLRRLLGELARLRLVTELTLEPLPVTEIETMLQATLGIKRPIRADFLHTINQRSEGNPFVVEELLRSVFPTGVAFGPDGPLSGLSLVEAGIPRTVSDAVVRRAERLSPLARELCSLAAVAGQRFEFALLQAITGHSVSELMPALKALIGAQLVIEESAERFRFRHALTREAFYLQLLAIERQALHQRIAETLEGSDAAMSEARLGELAYHFSEAHDWEKAAVYGERAGERAEALCAPRAAVEHFSRALDAGARLATPQRAALYRRRGAAFGILGDFEAARTDFEAALALAAGTDDAEEQWRTLLELGKLWASRDYAESGRCLREALALARERAEPEPLAYSLNSLGNWHLNVEEPEEALRLHVEALEVFQQAGDRRGIAEALDLLGMTSAIGGKLAAARTYYEQVAPLFAELGDRYGLASVQSSLALCAPKSQTETLVPVIRDFATVERWAVAGLTTARESDYRSGEAYALMILVGVYGARGRCRQALEAGRRGLGIATEILHREWMAGIQGGLGVLHLELLELDTACTYLRDGLGLAQQTRSLFWSRCCGGRLASALVQAHHLEEAGAVLDELIGPDTPMQTLGQRQCWYARGELAVARGAAEEALAIVRALAASASDQPAPRVPYLQLLEGKALLALERETEALTSLNEGIAEAAELELPPALWRLHAAAAAANRRLGRQDATIWHANRARDVAARLAGDLQDAALEARFLAAVQALLPGRPATARSRQAGGLSARELEIATFIAQGLTNRAIAERLVLSERTVESHVGNILARLSFATRAQIAAWVTETLRTDPA